MPRYIPYVEFAQVLRPFTSNVGVVREILSAFEQVVSTLVNPEDEVTPVAEADLPRRCRDTLINRSTERLFGPLKLQVQGELAKFNVDGLIQLVRQSAQDIRRRPGDTNNPSRVKNWLVRSAMHAHLLDVGSLMARIMIVNNWVTVWPNQGDPETPGADPIGSQTLRDVPEDNEAAKAQTEDIEDAREVEVPPSDREQEGEGEEQLPPTLPLETDPAPDANPAPEATPYREDHEWFAGQYAVAPNVELLAVGQIINVYDHANALAHPDEDAFCALCQCTAEEEEEAQELRFWAHLRVCSHSFHVTCLSGLLNSVQFRQNNSTCPLCKAFICPRRMAIQR